MANPPKISNTDQLASGILQDRIIGCLFGSALGDAIGLYTEFLPAAQAAQQYPTGSFTLLSPAGATPFCRDSHRAPHKPGNWTDDTDQALCILLSYLHNDGQILPADFPKRLRVWVDQGLRALDTVPLGLGFTIGSIVKNPVYAEDPIGVSQSYWKSKPKDFKPAPNGSLMRTHPLGLMTLTADLESAFDTAGDFSAMTHIDPRCMVACAIGTALVRGIVLGEVYEEQHIDEIVTQAVAWYDGKHANNDDDKVLDRAELDKHVNAADLAALNLDENQRIGYVYKTLGSGTVLLRRMFRELKAQGNKLSVQLAIYEKLITELVMCGGDADTNACFAGALLGAVLGYKALPGHWRDGLRHGSWLLAKAEGLCQVVGVTSGEYKGSEDKDTAPDGGRGFLSAEQMDERWKAHVQMIVDEKAQHEALQRPQKQKSQTGTWKNAFGFGS